MRFRMFLTVGLIASLTVFGCSGTDDDDDDSDDSDPVATSTGSGTSGGSGSSGSGGSGAACRSKEDCDNWACYCEDGSVVNSSLCNNGSCAPPEAHCPSACAAFNAGDWTERATKVGGSDSGGETSSGGSSGGTSGSTTGGDSSGSSTGGTSGTTSGGSSGGSTGGDTGDLCSNYKDCREWYCICEDGTTVASQQCTNGRCDGPEDQCQAACLDLGHGDWTGRIEN